MFIYTVVSAKCSEMGFSTVNVLGSFIDEEDAKAFRKTKLIELVDNYKITVNRNWLNLKKTSHDENLLPSGVKNGYDVA